MKNGKLRTIVFRSIMIIDEMKGADARGRVREREKENSVYGCVPSNGCEFLLRLDGIDRRVCILYNLKLMLMVFLLRKETSNERDGWQTTIDG